ncbi:MAG TPA: dolichyl-phosphate beta-glucosyltransferase [Acidobacteriota bacterium]|nr:dolichyl-phosphate beta-glucosyltransferase [Acidobacteriota bacterium]
MSTPSRIHLSVVIPAYNEELRLPETLRQSVRYLASQPYGSEVIVVDDGSTDGTHQVVLKESSYPVPVRLLVHADRANHGKGASVSIGMKAAEGDFRLFMDADNSTTLDQVEHFWPSFAEGFDLVIGSRKVAGANVAVHQAPYKEIAGRLGNWVIRGLVVPGISDTQAGFKVFTRRSAEVIFPRLTLDRWGFDIEILAIARCHGYRIRELPITWINSPGSKVGFGSYFQVLSDVWRVRRNIKSGRYK